MPRPEAPTVAQAAAYDQILAELRDYIGTLNPDQALCMATRNTTAIERLTLLPAADDWQLATKMMGIRWTATVQRRLTIASVGSTSVHEGRCGCPDHVQGEFVRSLMVRVLRIGTSG